MKQFSAVAYGLDPKGVADSSGALRTMFDDINAHVGPFTVMFEPGVYRVDQIRVTGGPDANSITELRLEDRRSFTISGYGATLSFAGGFQRGRDGFEQSVGLVLAGCSDFVVEGLEIDGNADTVSRHPQATEAYGSSGLSTESCSCYELRDLDIHHTTGDGILLGGATRTYQRADHDGRVRRVHCWANARNALTIAQAEKLRITDCTFEHAGRTGRPAGTAGPYEGHSPQACCDIEPGYRPDEHPDVVDRWTGDIVFRRCRFRRSVGPLFASVNITIPGRVRLESCVLEGDVDTRVERVPLTSPDVEVDGCTFLDAPIFGTFDGGAHDRTLTIRRSTILSSSISIRIAQTAADGQLSGAIVDNLIVRTPGPQPGDPYPLQVRVGRSPDGFRFDRNVVVFDETADDPADPNPVFVALLQTLDSVDQNSFATNLTAAGRRLAVNYDGSTVGTNRATGQINA